MTAERGRAARISKRTVDGAQPEAARYVLWDADLKGFGLRVTPQGTKTYIARYRVGGGRAGQLRQMVVGRHGPLTADEARGEAKAILAAAARGGDPQADRSKVRADLTVSELCDLYLSDGIGTKKASTIYTDKSRIERHIKPLLGRKRVNAITLGDVERFMHDVAQGKTASVVKPTLRQIKAGEAEKGTPTRKRTDPVARGGKGTASRTAGLLGGIFSFAVRQGLRPDNPTVGLQRFRDRKAERFLPEQQRSSMTDGALMAMFDATTARLLRTHPERRAEIEALALPEKRAQMLKNVRVGALIDSGTQVPKVLASRGLALLTIPGAKRSFVLGSRPVVKMGIRGATDLNDERSEVWLPIAPDVAVGPGKRDQWEQIFPLTEAKPIRELNEATWSQSSMVVAKSPDLVRSLASPR